MKTFSRVLLFFLLVAGIVRAWHNPSGSHGQRQVDTAGVALSIALETQKRGVEGTWNSFWYPRLLQRGLSNGANITEMPILNLLAVPFFLISPHAGNFFGSLLIFFLNLLAAWKFLPWFWRNLGIQLPSYLAVPSYFSLGSVAFAGFIFMPEGLAFPILLAAAAISTDPRMTRNPKLWIAACFLFNLALAIKPSAAVALAIPGLFLLYKALGPSLTGKPTARDFISMGAMLALSLCLPGFWYVIHAPEIQKFSNGRQIFHFPGLHPLLHLKEVGIGGLVDLIPRQLNIEQFPYLTAFFWLFSALFTTPLWMLFCLGIMLVGAISLVGDAVGVHSYYFFACSLMTLAIMGKTMDSFRTKGLRFLYGVSMALLTWGTLYTIRTQFWMSANTKDWWTPSAKIAAKVPENTHMISDDDPCCPSKLLRIGHAGTLAGTTTPLQFCQQPEYKNLKLGYFLDRTTYEKEIQSKNPCIIQTIMAIEEKNSYVDWVLLIQPPSKTGEKK